MKSDERPELGAGRVAFLARLTEIKERIEAGRTDLSVYREYQKQLPIGPSQFSRYVNKFIRSKPKNESEGEPTPPAVETKSKEKSKQPFRYDANRGNTDDFS